MKASAISIDQAKKDKLFYFVANVVVYRRKDARCLILKRHEREKVHPGKYAVPGGKLEWKDIDLRHPTRMNGDVIDFENAIEDLVEREVKEEAGISLKPGLAYLNSVAFVRPDGIPVVLVKFAAEYKSGTVEIESDSFTDFAWVDEKEVMKYSCIDGIRQEVKRTIQHFKKNPK